MADQVRELDGDPDAMRAFAERVVAPRTQEAVRSVPDGNPGVHSSTGGRVFTIADAASTVTVAAFLAETERTIDELRAAAHHAAGDYHSTDQSGAAAFVTAVELPDGGTGER